MTETAQKADEQASGYADEAFEALLDYLKRSRGFDFTGYKRSSLLRRVQKQMQAVGINDFSEYQDYLEVHQHEFALLFNTILINITSFFRDALTWEYLSDELIPQMIASKPDNEPIRLWSAGCASGQEPCSLAMALAEKLGMEEFRERVKIYGTDLDEEALSQARAASYTPREVKNIPPPLLEKYFEFEAGHYVLNKDLRRAMIFGRHDLLQDAPISRIDLLVCRNTLMYFNSEMQAKILARFHFAVSDRGCLILGKAEMLFSHPILFLPLDLKCRVFVKVSQSSLRDRLMLMAQSQPDQMDASVDKHQRLREAVFHAGPTAQIVIDADGMLAMANERARALFRLRSQDIGRPLHDLEISYRPVELRSCIEQVYAERLPINRKEVPWSAGGQILYLNVVIIPLQESGVPFGVGIIFTDVTRLRQLHKEMLESNQELETAQEELQSASEELETTNEELYTSVEELETTNEELYTSVEELETTNEELQAINGELQALIGELRVQSGELNQVNAFLESILTSLRGGVIVMGRDLRIQIWNSRAVDMWGLRAEEVQGKPFSSLNIGLPVTDLLPAIQECLSDGSQPQQVTLPARNRRGKDIFCKVSITPLSGGKESVHGVILLMEEQEAEQ